MTMARMWVTLVALYVVIGVGAAAFLAWPSTSAGGGPAVHLKPKNSCLAPCGDMYKDCIREWKASPGVVLSIDTSPDFPAGNILKIEKKDEGMSEVALDMIPTSGKVGLLSRFRREGAVSGEMGLGQGAKTKWFSFGPLSWKPSGFPIWAGHEGEIVLPDSKAPLKFVLRLQGKGTVWLQQARLRSEE